MIDWTISVGHLLQIAVIGGGIFAFVFAVKSDVTLVKRDMSDIKEELKELRKVLTTQVDHDTRIAHCEEDIRELRADIKELRHGEGFVLPLGSGGRAK